MNIELTDFVEKFTLIFEDTDPKAIKPESNFRNLEEWDSMLALSLIAMVDDEYNTKLTGDDIRSSNTVADLFERIKNKNI